MGTKITLTASDGFKPGAYRADPVGKPKGGIVVVQEVFGVNQHIRNVTDRFAANGYAAIAPALFDRRQRDFESGYEEKDYEAAGKLNANPNWDERLMDTQAAINALQEAGPVGIVGYCLGGTTAFLASTRLTGIKAAISFYGTRILDYADEKPKVPMQMHFGTRDKHVPMSSVAIIQQKRADCEIYIYEADHGFDCDARAAYDKPSSDIARQRMNDFLAKHLK